MPRGSSPKREREYVELKTEFEREKRYPGREAEVASRIVNRQRAERGEAKSAGGTGTAPKASAKRDASAAKKGTPAATKRSRAR